MSHEQCRGKVEVEDTHRIHWNIFGYNDMKRTFENDNDNYYFALLSRKTIQIQWPGPPCYGPFF